MNYFAIAASAFTGLLGFHSLSHFVVVLAGKKRWTDDVWGPILQAAWAALMITLTVWLGSMVAA